mmetsp:Transcript_4198/g.10543  ORF Transcript_4198/g.10543 Transcript_4198/m.10543 type:complete len:240 (-) Transcript_4198:633-1352(-)
MDARLPNLGMLAVPDCAMSQSTAPRGTLGVSKALKVLPPVGACLASLPPHHHRPSALCHGCVGPSTLNRQVTLRQVPLLQLLQVALHGRRADGLLPALLARADLGALLRRLVGGQQVQHGSQQLLALPRDLLPARLVLLLRRAVWVRRIWGGIAEAVEISLLPAQPERRRYRIGGYGRRGAHGGELLSARHVGRIRLCFAEGHVGEAVPRCRRRCRRDRRSGGKILGVKCGVVLKHLVS